MNFEKFSPHLLRFAIEKELQLNNDTKIAAMIALTRLKKDPEYYHKKHGYIEMQKARSHKYIKRIPNGKAGAIDMKRNIVKIYDNLYFRLQKARTHKYIKRIPKPSGKGFLYFYTQQQVKDFKEKGIVPREEKTSGLFSGILSFFGLKDERQAKEKVQAEYSKHKETLSGISEVDFSSHLNEYLTNKKMWDAKIAGKKKAPTKSVNKKTGKVVKKGGGGEKKSGFKLSVMKTIAGIYGKIEKIDLSNPLIKKEEVLDEKSRIFNRTKQSSTIRGDNVRKIKIAREEITKTPSKEFLSENIGRVLRDHQKTFVNLAMETFVEKKSKAIFNLDGTGAGKTLQELGLAQTYLEKNPNKPVLIVTENKRIIEDAFLSDTKMINVALSHAQNQDDIKDNLIYITTYNRLKEFKDNNFGLTIFDESHNLKNKSQKTKNGEEIIDRSDNVGLFSATPLDKGSQIGYIAKAFNLNKTPIMHAIGYKLENQRTPIGTIKVWKAQETAEEIANRIDSFFHDLTEKGFAIKREVPMDNIETKISNVKLNTEQKSKYEGAEDNFFRSIERNPKLKATGLMELRRLTEELKIDTTVNKIITELKINPQKQIVLFATRVNDSEIYDEESLGSLKEISKILSDKGIEHAKVFASNKKAKEDIDKFQKGEIKVILTTPQSGGTGLSLDDVDGDKPRKAIVMTPPFSAMEFIQMAGRINRLNTKSKAEIELLSTETMTDSWNKDIIANKLLTLGSAVSGDYRKLDIKELDRLQFMGNEDQREYLKNKGMEDQKIPYFEERKININEFKKDRQKEDKSEKSIFPKYPLRNINAYKTFIPKDENLAWPDAEINFGKYKGKTLSQLQDKDSGYLGWLLSNIKSKYKNIVTDITFITEMSKAMNKAINKAYDDIYLNLGKARSHKYIKRIPKPSGKGFLYFYDQQQVKDFNEKGIVPKEKQEGGLFSGILSFFGLKDERQAKEKVQAEYSKHKKTLSGISEVDFSSHLNEYLTNKKMWDAKIAGKKKAPTKSVNKKTGKVVKKGGGGEKKSGFKLSVMKTIAGIYGGSGKIAEAKDEKAVMSEEEYLESKGASKGKTGEAALHKNRGGMSDKQWSKMVDSQAEKDRKILEKRDELRKEYKEKVEKGEIKPPTRIESLIRTAQGHEDNEATKAAQKLLKKRGIDWEKPNEKRDIMSEEGSPGAKGKQSFNQYTLEDGSKIYTGSPAKVAAKTKSDKDIISWSSTGWKFHADNIVAKGQFTNGMIAVFDKNLADTLNEKIRKKGPDVDYTIDSNLEIKKIIPTDLSKYSDPKFKFAKGSGKNNVMVYEREDGQEVAFKSAFINLFLNNFPSGKLLVKDERSPAVFQDKNGDIKGVLMPTVRREDKIKKDKESFEKATKEREQKPMNKAYIKIKDNLYIDLSKAKAVPVGTISKDGRTKKAAEGKWVPVGKDKPKKTDDKSPDNKSPELDEKNKGTIKNVLKRVASILAEALSGKDTVSPTGTTIEEAGESATAKKKKIPTGKDTKKE